MREYEIKPNLQNILKKLSKKDKVAYEAILDKIEEIMKSEDIEHYKYLVRGLQVLHKEMLCLLDN